MSSIPAAEDDLVCQEGSGVSAAAVMADSVLSESMTPQQVVESLTKFNQRVSFTNNILLKVTYFLHNYKLSPSMFTKEALERNISSISTECSAGFEIGPCPTRAAKAVVEIAPTTQDCSGVQPAYSQLCQNFIVSYSNYL